MAIIKTTNTTQLAELIHVAASDIVEEMAWAARRIFHTAGELRRADEWGYLGEQNTRVDSGSARVYAGYDEDGTIHQYTFFGSHQNSATNANALRWEMDFEGRSGGDYEVDDVRVDIDDFRVYSDSIVDIESFVAKARIKEDGESESYTLAISSDGEYQGSIDYGYQGPWDEVDSNVGVSALAGSRLYSVDLAGKSAAKGYSETYVFSLQSADGLIYAGGNAGSLQQLSFASKGKLGKLAFDEAYTSQDSLADIGAALLGGDLTQLTDLLLAGNDSITGGKGSDFLAGGRGADTLKGGAGRDIFHFAAGDSGLTQETADRILDFKGKQDKLQFEFAAESSDVLVVTAKQASLSAFEGVAAEALAAGSRVVVGGDGKQGYVLVDSSGDGQADMLIQLAGIKSASKIAPSDFAFA